MDFDWDEGNRDKNLRHGVHDWEIEEGVLDQHSFVDSAVEREGEERFVLLGRSETSGKYLRIVYTLRAQQGEQFLRPISAVEMTFTQRRRYRQRL